MNTTEQTQQYTDISNVDVQAIMEQARIERARMMRELLAKLSRRQVLPVWNQTFKMLFARFSH
ncbi:RSP_7527 family protein [Marinobacterium sedimentorum]|jgi:hypothetical protein|uniref:RSP_7527 family protein n=1 Tax=Marinobacterium sedimentorum TaxID=2927804 RepID=UPI0020C60641|nr:hypothetical protein [Marinobacterium sedimentorum]MCP8687790.1 hypothetical protein [Marinobacterium sedimentorum]